jgi:hypothetical protein
LTRASAHFHRIANAFLRAFENGFRHQVANRVCASGKTELNAHLVEHKGHKVNVFLVEWHVLKDAIGRHRTSCRGAHINARPRAVGFGLWRVLFTRGLMAASNGPKRSNKKSGRISEMLEATPGIEPG